MNGIDRVDGWLVNRVEVGPEFTVTGVLRRVDDRTWVEEAPTGGPALFTFREVNRDDWSVYLEDPSRGVFLQLDLHTKKVMYRVGDAASTPLYDVVRAAVHVNALVASRVDLVSGDRRIGVFRQIGQDRWAEEGPNGGAAAFTFDELDRDDWSVYLVDRSRNVFLQLDLHTKKVMYRVGDEPSTPLYDIGEIGISARASDPSDRPATLTFVNESSVAAEILWVDFLGNEIPRDTIAPGGSTTVSTFFGHIWVVREELSRRRLRAWRASVEEVDVPVSTNELRSTGGPPVTTTFKNLYTRPVDLVWVSPDGDERPLHTLAPAEHVSLGGSAGDVVKCVSDGADIGVLLVGVDERQYRVITSGPARRPEATLEFRNTTPLNLGLWLNHDGDATRFHGLAAGESVSQPVVFGESWVARDEASGRLVQELVASADDDVVSLTTLGLRSESGAESVNISFSNESDLSGGIWWVAPDGVEHDRGTLAPRSQISLDGVAGDVWRFRESTTDREVGVHCATTESSVVVPFAIHSTHSRSRSVLDIQNRTLLTGEVMWVDGDGVEHSRGMIAPWSQVRFATHLTHPWVIRERDSRIVLDFVVARLPKETMVIDASDLSRVRRGTEVAAEFHNLTGFTVELVDLDAVASDPVAVIERDDTVSVPSMPGRSFGFREPVSRGIFGTYVCRSDPEQFQTIELTGRGSGMSSSLTLFNSSAAEVNLYRYDDDGEHFVTRIEAWDTSVQDSVAGWVWLAREARTGLVLACTMSTGTARTSRITTDRLRPIERGTDVELTLVNRSGIGVDMTGIELDGSQRPLGTVPAGAEHVVTSFFSHIIRFTDPATGEEVDVCVTGEQAAAEFTIQNNLVARAVPAGGLRPGEVAIYPEPDYVGDPIVAHSQINDLSAVGGDAASLKLGPSTGIIAYQLAGKQGQNDVFHLDTPTLTGTDVGAGFGSFEVFTVATPTAHVTSVSTDLTKDYRYDSANRLEEYSAYRTVVNVPPEVNGVMVWATEEVTVNAGGASVTLYPDVPTNFTPTTAGSLMLAIPATRLGAPALMMRTDAMQPGHRFFVFPDRSAMQRLRELPDGELWNHRDRLGLEDSRLGADDAARQTACAQVQQALKQLASSVPDVGAVAAQDRSLDPSRMDYDAWSLDMRAGPPTFMALTPDDAGSVPVGRPLDGDIRQFLDVLVRDIDRAVIRPVVRDVARTTNTVLTTLDRAGKDVAKTVGDVGNEIDRAVIQPTATWIEDEIIEPAVEGIANAVQAVGQVIDDAGQLITEGIAVVGELIDEAAETLAGVAEVVLAFTAQVGDDIVTAIVDTAEKVAAAVTHIVEAVGAAIEDFIDFLESVFDWDAIVSTHDLFIDLMNQVIGRAEPLLNDFRPRVAEAIDGVERALDSGLESARQYLRAIPPPEPKPRPESTDGLEWLMNEVMSWLDSVDDDSPSFGSDESEAMIAAAGKLAAVETSILGATSDAIAGISSGIEAIMTSPPEEFARRAAGLVLSIAEVILDQTVELVRGAADALIDLMVQLVGFFDRLLNAELDIPLLSDFYEMIADRPLTVLGLVSLMMAVPASIAGRGILGDDWPPTNVTLDPASIELVQGLIGVGVHSFRTIWDPAAVWLEPVSRVDGGLMAGIEVVVALASQFADFPAVLDERVFSDTSRYLPVERVVFGAVWTLGLVSTIACVVQNYYTYQAIPSGRTPRTRNVGRVLQRRSRRDAKARAADTTGSICGFAGSLVGAIIPITSAFRTPPPPQVGADIASAVALLVLDTKGLVPLANGSKQLETGIAIGGNIAVVVTSIVRLPAS